MGNYSYLSFTADLTFNAESESPTLSSKYHIPIFWFALFAASDMLVRQYPGEEGDHEPWPDLVKNRRAAIELFISRKPFLVAKFPQIDEFWLTQFVAFLEAAPDSYVSLDYSQVVGDVFSGASWADELRGILKMFEVPMSHTKAFLGFSWFGKPPNYGLVSYMNFFGTEFASYRARQPWAYTGHGIEALDELFFNPPSDLFTREK